MVIVDDVLATGKTLCAVWELVGKTSVDAEHITSSSWRRFPITGAGLCYDSMDLGESMFRVSCCLVDFEDHAIRCKCFAKL